MACTVIPVSLHSHGADQLHFAVCRHAAQWFAFQLSLSTNLFSLPQYAVLISVPKVFNGCCKFPKQHQCGCLGALCRAKCKKYDQQSSMEETLQELERPAAAESEQSSSEEDGASAVVQRTPSTVTTLRKYCGQLNAYTACSLQHALVM